MPIFADAAMILTLPCAYFDVSFSPPSTCALSLIRCQDYAPYADTIDTLHMLRAVIFSICHFAAAAPPIARFDMMISSPKATLIWRPDTRDAITPLLDDADAAAA